MTLQCSKCRQHKVETEFYPDPKSKTGYQRWCVVCKSEYQKSRLYDPEVVRRRRQLQRMYYHKKYSSAKSQG